MTSEKVGQLQLTQQNLQSIISQKQHLEAQVNELNSALNEIGDSQNTFKIMGKVMVSTPKDKLKKELEEKKELVGVRLKNFTQQEEKLTQSIETLQKEVMEEMKGKKNE
jgi:prefoldin beta subunit